MKTRTILVVLCRDEVAPRFDMAVEALIASTAEQDTTSGQEPRHMLLAHPSGEEMCDLATRLGVTTVVCGGIEEDHFHFLRWKRVDVICNVLGQGTAALAAALAGTLQDGENLFAAQQHTAGTP
ncbi:hypothetical protein [Desulfovibrio cuneatus]|uniref:hypothetical protein n=1 Tax=Desulfovibrio cuneatus TaxID=159728 RepID=UPI00041C2227|nr:hypothetical protein [Desulfovibrio cuneatus]